MLDGTGLDFVSRGSLIAIVPIGDEVDEPHQGALGGRVVDADAGDPIPNALVRLADGRAALTSRNGSFFFRALAPGRHALGVTALGWIQGSLHEVDITEGDTSRVRLTLFRDVIPLPELLIEPGTFGLLEDVPPGTATAVTREETQILPQLGEDVFRAMKSLPGVTSGDISTRLTIRGGGDREVLVRLDGLELYRPYHVMDWDGALGIVDINVLGGVEVLTGGFGVEHGDRMAGVLDMTSRRPEGEAKTTLGLSVSNMTAISRGTFEGARGAWLFSVRRGFLDLLMDVANEGRRLSPEYHDIFGKVSYELGSSHRLSARFLLAGDGFLLRNSELVDLDEVDFESDWNSRYGWLTWEAFPGPMVSVKTMGWFGELDRRRGGTIGDASDTPFRISVSDRRDFSSVGLRSELTIRASDWALFSLGAEGKRLEAGYEYLHRTWSPYVTPGNTRGVREDTLSVVQDPTGSELSGFGALRARPGRNWVVEAGLRYDQISHTDDRDFAPRVTATYEVSPRTNLRISLGRYFQSHGLHELDVGDGETVYSPSEESRQLAFGLDHRFPGGVGLRLEAYSRTLSARRPMFLNVEQDLKVFPEAAGDRIRLDPDRGRSRGIEMLLERKSGARWAWAASYVLASAEDRVAGSWIPRGFDQRHAVTLQTIFNPSREWTFSMEWRFHTGWPATSWSWTVRPLDDGWNVWTQEVGPLRTLRLPAYHRLDIRIAREALLSGGQLQLFLDLFNVYNRNNLASWDYSGSYENGELTVRRLNGQEFLPFLPTFGLRYEF
jgi:outer membrane receptor protein involved in Fe transport